MLCYATLYCKNKQMVHLFTRMLSPVIMLNTLNFFIIIYIILQYIAYNTSCPIMINNNDVIRTLRYIQIY